MKLGVDSAYASTNPARLTELGWQFACGYIGGTALHVWSAEDWRNQKYAGLELLPIWVAPLHTAGYDAGDYDGNQALVKLQELGLAGIVILDVEAGACGPAYADGFRASILAGSCKLGVYGSSGGLTKVGTVSGDLVWLAMWPTAAQPIGAAPPDFDIWQYESGPEFDYNVARDDFPFATLT